MYKRQVITDKKGNIIANGNNKVLKNNDPTAHAEITAIREACPERGAAVRTAGGESGRPVSGGVHRAHQGHRQL